MSETTEVEETGTEVEGAPEGKPEPKTVSLSTYEKERRARRELEKRLAERDQQDEQRRQAELSESERLKEQLAQAESARQEAESRAQKSERRGWVRDAAAAAGFIDPGDAVAQIDVGDLDSESAAREAVADLKGRKPHLAPDNSGGPDLKKVLQDGKRPDDKQGEEKLLTKGEIDALSRDEIRALDDTKPGLLDRSLAALNT